MGFIKISGSDLIKISGGIMTLPKRALLFSRSILSFLGIVFGVCVLVTVIFEGLMRNDDFVLFVRVGLAVSMVALFFGWLIHALMIKKTYAGKTYIIPLIDVIGFMAILGGAFLLFLEIFPQYSIGILTKILALALVYIALFGLIAGWWLTKFPEELMPD